MDQVVRLVLGVLPESLVLAPPVRAPRSGVEVAPLYINSLAPVPRSNVMVVLRALTLARATEVVNVPTSARASVPAPVRNDGMSARKPRIDSTVRTFPEPMLIVPA